MSTTIPSTAFGIPSDEIWKSYLILGKIFATPSIVGSTFLARDIINKWHKKHFVALNNIILFGISMVDILGTFFSWFMTSWMVPRGDAPYAAGNQGTCDAQGFFVTFTFIYFVTAYTELAVLYWLIVARSWKDNYMKRTKIRLLFLAPPVVVGLFLAVAPLFYQMYNVALVFCYLSPYPPGCVGDECTRGPHSRNVQTAEFIYTLVCNVIIIIFMTMLVHHVRVTESKADKYAGGGRNNRKQTDKAYWQGFRYIVGFTVAYVWIYIFMAWNISGHRRDIGFVVLFYFHVVFNPLAGLFNAWVYFKPRYDTYKEQNPTKSRGDCIRHVLNIKGRVMPSWCNLHCLSCWTKRDVQSTPPTTATVDSSALVSPLIPESDEADENVALESTYYHDAQQEHLPVENA